MLSITYIICRSRRCSSAVIENSTYNININKSINNNNFGESSGCHVCSMCIRNRKKNLKHEIHIVEWLWNSAFIFQFSHHVLRALKYENTPSCTIVHIRKSLLFPGGCFTETISIAIGVPFSGICSAFSVERDRVLALEPWLNTVR